MNWMIDHHHLVKPVQSKMAKSWSSSHHFQFCKFSRCDWNRQRNTEVLRDNLGQQMYVAFVCTTKQVIVHITKHVYKLWCHIRRPECHVKLSGNFLSKKQLLKCNVLAYVCNAILRANNSVLYILAELNKVIFWKVMSASNQNSSSSPYTIIQNHNYLKKVLYSHGSSTFFT